MDQDESPPKQPDFSADHVRLYAENKSLRAEVEKLRSEREELYQKARMLQRHLDALHSLIERLD